MNTRPTFIIPVHGTWSLREDRAWWKKDSLFEQFCRSNGIHYKYPNRPFYWDGDVDGVGLSSLFGVIDKHDDWLCAGFSLDNYLLPIPEEDRNLILHSHAYNMFLYSDVKVRNIITVGSPIRNDMLELRKIKKDRIQNHLHIYDQRFDFWGTLGQFGDGRLFGSRAEYIDAVNHKLRGISHSKILRDPKYFELWISQGWFDFLRQ